MKSIKVISSAALFLLLGLTIATGASQEQQEKAKDQEKPHQQGKPAQKQQQPARPAGQSQPKAQQEQQHQGQSRNQQAQQRQQTKPQPAEQQHQSQGNSANQQQQSRAQQSQKQSRSQQQRQPADSTQPVRSQQAIGRQQSQQRPQGRQRTEGQIRTQRAEPELRLSSRGAGRIPENRFRSNFGRVHTFRIGSPRLVGGYSRFEYAGYWFGFTERWPDSWFYTDDVYVDYIDGGYFLYNPYYPGVRVSIVVVL